MDLFSNIDWANFKITISDIQQITNIIKKGDAKAKIELTKLIYQVEKDLASIKHNLELPLLNPFIDSTSIKTSFDRTPVTNDIFDKSRIVFDKFFRQNDYQYWLIIFLLLKNNNIREHHLTLYQIIDEFILRVKDKSFTWRDIEYTKSGATRSITNIRFAYTDLKNVGLVNLYDSKQKESWSLTFLGFFTAASFCLDPMDPMGTPFSAQISRFNQSTFYFKINKFIWERIDRLSNVSYFQNIIDYLSIENLGLPELKNGPEIFADYYFKVSEITTKRIAHKEKMKYLKGFLEEINEKYSLDEYMRQLSIKFDAEAFFDKLIKTVNEK